MCMTFIGSMGKYRKLEYLNCETVWTLTEKIKIIQFSTANLTDDLARRDLSHLENSISASFASTGSLLQNTSQPVNIPNSMSNSISGKKV